MTFDTNLAALTHIMHALFSSTSKGTRWERVGDSSSAYPTSRVQRQSISLSDLPVPHDLVILKGEWLRGSQAMSDPS